ncbi:MAG: DMT family transporter [Firmicutes bacterium]|nr:DMT family transporter [Bacillota bacterium]
MTEKRKGELQMLACAVMWSISGIMIKYIDWSPLAIAGGRSLISAGVVVVFMLATKMRPVVDKNVAWAGVTLFGCVTCFVTANKMTTAANAIVLQYIAPAFVLIISALFLKHKLKKMEVAIVASTFIGIILFFVDEIDFGGMLGNLIAICSGLFMAIMFVFNGKLALEARMTGILIAHLLTAIVGIPIGFATYETIITTQDIVLILILGIVQLGIPYVLYALAASKISPLSCSLIGMIEPLLNPIWVAVFYGEVPGFFALIGGIVVIVSVVIYNVWDEKQSQVGLS